jgi:hypothetical protein
MRGPLVPVVLAPRFTSFVGEGEFRTAPMDVSAYARLAVDFWRGPLSAGGAGAAFEAWLEGSTDPGALVWTDITPGGGPITADDTSSVLSLDLTYRYLRLRVVLTPDDDWVAITVWMAGSLEARIPGPG